jgi:hypothetical protein
VRHLSVTDRINQIVEGAEEATASEEVDPENIQITAPKEPEVDSRIYRNVESMLFRGFLVLPATINGVQFVFKSINHKEFEYLQWMSGPVGDVSGKSVDRYYRSFMAYGVFMIDGQNILSDRDLWVPQLEDMFASLPSGAKAKIIQYLSEVNQKASDAVTLTEAYQVESYSRYRWNQFKGLDLMSPSCTGVSGTQYLGLNFAQLAWRALNQYEDMKDSAEREWDNAKFIGSCFAGKEIRKIYNQDKDRRIKERQDKIERRDKVIRQVVLRESPNDAETKGRYVMKVARTADELASQLQSSLRGEKDWHDEVVAREEARRKEQVLERQQKLRNLYEDKLKDSPLPYQASTSMEGLSKSEVEDRIKHKKQLDAQRAASQIVYPEMMDDRMELFLNKYIGPEDSTYQTSGVGTTDRDPSEVRALPPPRPTAIPFRR